MKRGARLQQDLDSVGKKQGSTGDEKETTPVPASKRARVAEEEEEEGEETTSNQTTSLGLEAVGDDVLMLVMDLCGPTHALRAFLLANRRLHALLRSHRALWRRAYSRLFDPPRSHKKTSQQTQQLQHHLDGVQDYFEAYTGAMRKWTGEYDFSDGFPLGESDAELTVKVAPDRRATWEGFGVGCGRAGEYTSLNCLKGKGKLVLRFDKKGEIQAFAAGAEDSKKGRCDRPRREDRDYDDDDDDDDDDEEEEGSERAKEKKRAREERRRKKAQEGDPIYKWVKESLRELEPMFFERVDYQLHVQGKRRWCTGGGACRFWEDDMEW